MDLEASMIELEPGVYVTKDYDPSYHEWKRTVFDELPPDYSLDPEYVQSSIFD